MKFHSKIVLLLSCFLFVGCSTVHDNKDRLAKANLIANTHGFTKDLVKGGDFWLTIYKRIENNKPYVFYIEGDGFPYYRKSEISPDPTPKDSLVLKLAALDPRPNIVYIARPCQYTDPELNPLCRASHHYWTLQRMSEKAVESINQVIIKTNNDQPFSLVGYSGGGGIAVLLGARNDKVKDILTIAANLDIHRFVADHKVSIMKGSLNPMDYAKKINHIPQLHLSGGKDNIVKPFIADEYVKASNSICVYKQEIENNTHSKGWENIWPDILAQKISCDKIIQ